MMCYNEVNAVGCSCATLSHAIIPTYVTVPKSHAITAGLYACLDCRLWLLQLGSVLSQCDWLKKH